MYLKFPMCVLLQEDVAQLPKRVFTDHILQPSNFV